MTEEIPELTPAHVQAMTDQLSTAVATVNHWAAQLQREARHMERQRLTIAWAALALTAAATASLFVARVVTDSVLSGMQLILWSTIAALNFGGPNLSEWLVKRKRKP